MSLKNKLQKGETNQKQIGSKTGVAMWEVKKKKKILIRVYDIEMPFLY